MAARERVPLRGGGDGHQDEDPLPAGLPHLLVISNKLALPSVELRLHSRRRGSILKITALIAVGAASFNHHPIYPLSPFSCPPFQYSLMITNRTMGIF